MTNEEINKRLEELRVLWKRNPSDRHLLEVRARFLKYALEKRQKREPPQQSLLTG
jgi:hypothetical protein